MSIEVPGLRIIKTVVAVLIVLIIARLTNYTLRSYEMAVVAILALRTDAIKTFQEAKNRISSTIIGGIIGTFAMCISYLGDPDVINIVVVPIGVFLILYLCSKLINKTEYIVIACYVFLAITLDNNADTGLIYPLMVMANTIVASIVAMIVNLCDPKKIKSFIKHNKK